MENRVTELEIKLAHLEDGLNQLSDVVTDQRREIDTLSASHERLARRLADAEDSLSQTRSKDEKPPHY